ncbi:ComEC/Rec2 family competence protein [Microbacterium sp.]|uniref:ComEC/Rec2 family competence protein n=1 Tax=Microbacterium sp. TaxID=51671 RepID=UPI003A900A5E
MRVRDLRLVPVAGGGWAAAGFAVLVPDAASAAALALWACALVLTACTARHAVRSRTTPAAPHPRGRAGTAWAIAAVTVAIAAAAASSVALALPQRDAAAHLAVSGGRAVTVHATVVGKAQRTATGDLMYDAVAHRVDIGTAAHPVDVPISVRDAGTGSGSGPDIGSEIDVQGTASVAQPDHRAVLVVRAAHGVTVTRAATGVVAASAGMRHALAQAVRGLPEPGAGLIPGLAVGDTGGVSAQLDAQMKASSLSHLTAVSGANCAIVVGLAFGAAALCGARRGVRVTAGLAALGGFVLLVTPEPSVVRAAAMAAIAMLGVLLGRRGAGLSLLCGAVAACVVADPWLAVSMGFALSVVATAALLVLAAPLARGMTRHLPRALALALAVPLAAQLACGPLLIMINPTVPLYGVVANLLAAPAAPVATILGLAACVAAPIPALASGLVALTWLPAAWIAATAATSVDLPASAVPWLEGWPGAVALTIVGGAIALVLLPVGPARWHRTARVASALLLAVVVGVGAGTAALRAVAGPLTLPGAWAIAACDVGQGDAILVRSHGAVALIDTGPRPDLLRACLDRFGIARVDLLVLTHYDLDHSGGVDAVVGRVGTVLHGPVVSPADGRTLDTLVRAGAQAVDAWAGMSGMLGAATWTVVWPREGDRMFTGGNEASVVLDVRGGGVPASLYLGDMDATSQRALLASGALRSPYAVVKVAHHGSADQSPELYRAMGGAVALVSVGVDNDYGHPRAETLAFLRADGYAIARTDTEGVVTVSSTAEAVGVWRERPP